MGSVIIGSFKKRVFGFLVRVLLRYFGSFSTKLGEIIIKVCFYLIIRIREGGLKLDSF